MSDEFDRLVGEVRRLATIVEGVVGEVRHLEAVAAGIIEALPTSTQHGDLLRNRDGQVVIGYVARARPRE
jgi:hypothetical protein